MDMSETRHSLVAGHDNIDLTVEPWYGKLDVRYRVNNYTEL